MAEKGHNKSVCNKIRNYKDVSSSFRDIQDSIHDRKFTGVFVGKKGSLFAADVELKEVCVFNRNGKLVKTFPLDFLGDEDILDIVELSNGNIVVSSYYKDVVRMFTSHGELVETLEANPLPKTVQLGLAVNNEDQVFVVPASDPKVRVFDGRGKFQYSFECDGLDLDEPFNIGFACNDNHGQVYLTDHDSNRVLVFQQNGKFLHEFSSDTLDGPTGIAATNDGHLVVSSSSGSKLSIFTTSGECVHEVEDPGLEEPYGVAVDDNGFIYVADCSRIAVF